MTTAKLKKDIAGYTALIKSWQSEYPLPYPLANRAWSILCSFCKSLILLDSESPDILDEAMILADRFIRLLVPDDPARPLPMTEEQAKNICIELMYQRLIYILHMEAARPVNGDSPLENVVIFQHALTHRLWEGVARYEFLNSLSEAERKVLAEEINLLEYELGTLKKNTIPYIERENRYIALMDKAKKKSSLKQYLQKNESQEVTLAFDNYKSSPLAWKANLMSLPEFHMPESSAESSVGLKILSWRKKYVQSENILSTARQTSPFTKYLNQKEM